MKKRIHVKPVTNKTEVFGYLTLKFTIWGNFWDDKKRYGLKVATHNLFIVLKDSSYYYGDDPPPKP